MQTKTDPEKNLDDVEEKKTISNFKNQLKSTNQIKSNTENSIKLNSSEFSKLEIKKFEDLLKIATTNKEVELKYDLERNVRLINFSEGKINITFNEELNKNFIKILTEKLLKWTGKRWIITLSKEDGGKTFYEKNNSIKESKIKEAKNSKLVKNILSAFPDAKLIDVKEDEDA